MSGAVSRITGKGNGSLLWHMNFINYYAYNLEFWIQIVNDLCPHSMYVMHVYPAVILSSVKFDIWICQRNAHVKFKFGHGLMIFGRVMPLSFWKDKKFQFLFIICPTFVHIQLKFNISICHRFMQVKFDFGHGLIIFGSYASLKKIINHFPLIFFPTGLHIQLKFNVWVHNRNV
jgi:hypothetical protein